jgi:fumarate hydratase class I
MMQMLIIEYYAGLELLRVFLIFYIIKRDDDKLGSAIKKTLLNWLPYFFVFILFVFFRLSVLPLLQQEGMTVKNTPWFLTAFQQNPFNLLIHQIEVILQDLVYAVMYVWSQTIVPEDIDIQALIERGPQNAEEALRLDIFERVNKLGIGAQGLGGLTTVVDVKIKTAPTHAASKPVCLIPNCAATRHIHFTLDGSGPAEFTPPKLEDWPDITWEAGENTRRVNLDTVTRQDVRSWKTGETLLLSGKILTGRDAAHKRIQTMLQNGEGLPEGVELKDKFIYYVGPVDAVGDEVVGPAGPTTSTRMDKFTDMMLDEVGIMGMIGKAERGATTVDSIRKHQAVYLMAVGGAAYLVAKAIKKARVVAFEELGMEAIYEFEVEDMPVTVAVDATGANAHQIGPDMWRVKIAEAAS